ncbi:hypothetical protein BHE90_005948 [Fusarium euwallaceae]|uniref:Uncharacterized protein n=2 Tax=Fusarium solani species complex TaxID=232080 RepID=A0A3M2RWA6_9HYPO|nr:hypothetical protein CDV36_010800 [Fusarium kuroshium]RTE79551.1 hypothetical protein BHE90_005948 [Fusarium euwallaceae]
MSIITTTTLERLWNDAQRYPEWATTRLWEHIFNRIAFPSEPWLVSSQQPPTHTPGDLRRVDLVVENIDPAQGNTMTLLFMEAKRASASPSEIITVETQAYTAACAYAVDLNSTEPIWTMTCVGSTFRLWIFDWEKEFLVPYFPATYDETKSAYLEISKRGTELLQHLNFIKRHPKPPQDLIGEASPRPLNADLPSHWTNDEVMLRDAQHQNVRHDPEIGTTYGEVGYDPTPPGTYINQTVTTGVYSYDPRDYPMSDWDLAQTTQADGTLFPEGMPDPGENLPETGSISAPFPEGPTVTGNPSARSAEKWSRVEVHKKRHLTRPAEYVFTTDNDHEKSTDADDWRETRHKGKKAWYYLHKGVKYYTREKPGV